MGIKITKEVLEHRIHTLAAAEQLYLDHLVNNSNGDKFFCDVNEKVIEATQEIWQAQKDHLETLLDAG